MQKTLEFDLIIQTKIEKVDKILEEIGKDLEKREVRKISHQPKMEDCAKMYKKQMWKFIGEKISDLSRIHQ